MKTMILTIGKRLKCDVTSLEDASSKYQAARNESGEGASTFPCGKVRTATTSYHISYNGRVWDKAQGQVVLEATKRIAS